MSYCKLDTAGVCKCGADAIQSHQHRHGPPNRQRGDLLLNQKYIKNVQTNIKIYKKTAFKFIHFIFHFQFIKYHDFIFFGFDFGFYFAKAKII